MDESLDLLWKVTIIEFYIILENEACYSTGGFRLGCDLGEDEHQIIIEVWILIQCLKSLQVPMLL